MDIDQTLIGEEDKKWDRPWTTDEIRKNSPNWTLAGDVGLYNLLTEMSQNIISRTHEVENAVDSLVFRTKMANVKICNIINDFHMLSNLQFVENRVYDEEIIETTPEVKPEKTKEQKEAEMLPKIIKAVELGLQVLDQAFTKVHVDEISDSEDEDLSSEGRMILEPKDPYEHRPLPFIIGSEEFNNSEYAGLQDLLEEDVEYSVDVESSVSDTDETTTDEEEHLPLDEDKFTGTQNQQRLPLGDSDKFSSSEESELFGSEKEENGFISDSDFDRKSKKEHKIIEDIKTDQKDSRQSSISSTQPKLNLPQVLPVPQRQEKKKVSEDLFAHDDETSDDDSPFRKKTGLFTSDVKFDDDEKDIFDSDLFGEKAKETKKSESPKSTPPIKTKTPPIRKKKDEPTLFGNDEDSDEDIFNTIMKTKSPSIVKENKVTKQNSSEKADSSSTPSSAPSTKPSGNAFDFMGGGSNSLFGDESDGDDLFSIKKSTKKFDFDAQDDDEEDLFGLASNKTSKKAEVPEPKKSEEEKKPSLFEASEEVDKPYKKIGTALPGMVPLPKAEEPAKAQKSYMKIGQPLPGLLGKKNKDSIFDDSDSSGQEDKPLPTPVKQAPPKKKDINLFEDEPDEDDIFSQVPKKLMSPGESPSLINKSGTSQFSKLQGEEKSVKVQKKDVSNLFMDDDDDVFKQDIIPKPSAVSKKKELSLFEESDNFDLFSPKAENKKESVATPAKAKESVKEVIVPKVSDEINSFPSSKQASKAPQENMFSDIPDHGEIPAVSKTQVTPLPSSPTGESSEASIGFDAPPDSSKTLQVLSKSRPKMVKRRNPTKRGRLAALENSATEPPPETASPSTSASSAPDDDLFSGVQSTPPPSSQSPSSTSSYKHKSQEKKKMNLMAQLMSEVATTKIGKKSVAPVLEDNDDDIDIFAEAQNRDRSKSSFSFNSPIESIPPKSSVSDKKDEKSPEVDLLNSEDADNDDFFAEPSFRKSSLENFRTSISHKDSILNLDDDDDDDLFSTIKSNPLEKAKAEASEKDIFADDSDIFADIQKEKYEMFPSNIYDDDEGDDIFSIADPLSSTKATVGSTKPPSTKPPSAAVAKKEPEKKPVDIFQDPLSGLLGDD